MKNKLLLISSFLLAITLVNCNDSDDKCSNAPLVNAGKDTIVLNSNAIQLSASTDADSGKWSILTGNDGKLENCSNAKTNFTGSINNKYSLVWESSNDCGTSKDTINIEFKSQLSADDMANKLHWIMQSCFRIEGTNYKIYIDPQGIKTKDSANIILITHSHSDHFLPSDIAKLSNKNTTIYGPVDCKYTGVCKELIVIKPGDEKILNEYFKIKAVPAYNNNHLKISNWVGYLITIDGVTIYHSGDTKRIDEMKTFTCDIALLPLGQTYTFSSVAEAAEAAKDVQAKIAIPMHYGLYEGKAADAETFKSLLDGVIKVIIKTKE
jgi:L-ascorbate metabolism protein UlaG (beta-lactamase superfamily)